MTPKILIIEDDASTIELIGQAVREQFFSIEVSQNGKTGLDLAMGTHYDLIILDLNLPEISGLDICRKLREKKPQQLVLMLTGRSASIDRVLGLELGADDYVVKPFDPTELVARIRALLRRNQRKQENPTTLTFQELSIDPAKRMVVIAGKQIKLTAVEFDILFYLASNAGRVITRDELKEAVWDFRASEFDATITSHLSRVRSKIENNPTKPIYIKTVYGVGYKFSDVNELEIRE